MSERKITKNRVKATGNETMEFLKSLSNMLNDIDTLKKEGREDEMNILTDLFNKKCDEKREELEKEIESYSCKDVSVDRSNIPASGSVLAENDKVILKIISQEERESYLEVSYECSLMKSAFKDERFRDDLWDRFNGSNVVTASIYDKSTSDYVGYCSVNDIEKNDWEISMELKNDYQSRGYGFNALKMFIEKLTELTGHRFYKARIDIDNKASQNLVKKLGAYPDGISEYLLHGDKLLEFQKENIQFIDEDIRAIAEEFCMEPEDILGHVLEYRIDAYRE